LVKIVMAWSANDGSKRARHCLPDCLAFARTDDESAIAFSLNHRALDLCPGFKEAADALKELGGK